MDKFNNLMALAKDQNELEDLDNTNELLDEDSMEEPIEDEDASEIEELPVFNNVTNYYKSKPKFSLEDLKKPFNEFEGDAFLRAIGMNESSGGLNTEHDTMQHGLHKGDTAQGTYGLMPRTARDVAKAFKNKENALRRQLNPEYSDPEVEQLADMEPADIEDAIKQNPDLEKRLARYLYLKIAARNNNDPDRMAYAWRNGSSFRASDITPAMLEKSGYVKSFREQYRQLKQPRSPAKK